MKTFLKALKGLLEIGLVIAISISAIFVTIYLLFFGNRRYTFPAKIGEIELNYEVQPHVHINGFPADILETLDRIEQEQGYIDIEELEQLREKIEGIDGTTNIVYSYRRPVRYFYYYEGESILGEHTDEYGSHVICGEDNGNVLYFYRVRKKIDLDNDGFLIPLH